MKYLTFDLQLGTVRPIKNYLTQILDKIGCTRITQRSPIDFYLIICPVQNMSWYNKTIDFDSEILNDVKNKDAGLILTTDNESFCTIPRYQRITNPNIIDHIRKSITKLNLENDLVLYIDSNYKITNLLAKHNLKGLWLNIWETYLPPIDTTLIKENIILKQQRDKKFLYFGGKARDFRLQFVNELLKLSNINEHAFISTGRGSFLDFFTKENKFMETIVLDEPKVNELPEEESIKISDYHKRSYFNIIPSSSFYFNHSQLEFTEKFFKPIITLQPFIILGEPFTLSLLHDLGYKTFDKWIDESYDRTLDDKQRFVKILDQITKLNNLPYTQLNDMLVDMLPILEHNQNLQKQRYYEPNITLLNNIKGMFNLNQ